MAVAGALVLGAFFVRGFLVGGEPELEETALSPPAPGPGETLGGPAGLTAGKGMRLQFTDPDDPSKVTGELLSESVEPMEGRRYQVVEPVVWLYQDDGRSLLVKAAEGRLYMPSQSREPESGRLEGGVTVQMYEPRADGTWVRSEEGATASLVAHTEWLEFDTALGEASTDSVLTIETPEMTFRGTRVRARFDEVGRRLVLLEVKDGGVMTYDPAAQSGGEKTDEGAAASKPVRPTGEPTNAPENAQGAPGQETVATAPNVVLYHAMFDGDVVLSQPGRAVQADLLEVWARTVDNKLRENAIRRIAFVERARRAMAPLPLNPVRLAIMSVFAVQEGAEPKGAELEGVGSDDGVSKVVTLSWSGPLRVEPVKEAEELRRDELAFRFSSEAPGPVRFQDEEMEAEGEARSLSYAATTARLAMIGSASEPAWVSVANDGRLECDAAVADLANGLIQLEGRCVADAGEGRGQIRCTQGADVALHFLEGKLTSLIREAVFNGDVVAADDDSTAVGQVARGQFAMEVSDDGTPTSRLEHFHLEDAEGGLARLARGDDELLEGRVIDVDLVAGPEDEPDPSHIEVVGDVRGVQGDSVLVAKHLTADLERDDEGELVVTSAEAGGGIRFVRASDEIEAVAEAMTSLPSMEQVTLLGVDSMVRQRTARIFGRQITLDGLAKRIGVFGEGRLDDREGSGTTASWSREMAFDDSTGELECHGDVVARMEPDALSKDTIRAHRLYAVLAASEKEGEEADEDVGGALDLSVRSLAQDRVLVSALAIGSIEEMEDGDPASVQSVRYEVLDAEAETPTYRPVQTMLLEGARIEVSEEGSHLDVPVPGRLVVSDERKKVATPDDESMSDARGRAMFTWEGTFGFDRAAGEATMLRTVKATMQEPELDRVTFLDAERVVVTFAEEEGETQPTLAGARADGAVYMAQTVGRERVFEMIADVLKMDNIRKTAEAIASEGNVVTVFEGARPTPATAKRLMFDLASGRWEVREPGMITSPK